ARKCTRPNHAGLVDDENRVATEPIAAIEIEQRLGDGRAVDTGGVLQLERGASSDRAAVHADAARLPHVARRSESSGLPGPGSGAHDLDARTRRRDALDQGALLVPPQAADGRMPSHAFDWDLGGALVAPNSCVGQQTRLDSDEF